MQGVNLDLGERRSHVFSVLRNVFHSGSLVYSPVLSPHVQDLIKPCLNEQLSSSGGDQVPK